MTTFFVLYGESKSSLIASIATDTDLIALAKESDDGFNPGNYATDPAALAAAEKVLMQRYKILGLFEYDLNGMTAFLTEAESAGELVGLHALELAEKFANSAQRLVMRALTEAQKKVIGRVQYPQAGNEKGFNTYQEEIALIRGKSIAALCEYVANGDETPE